MQEKVAELETNCYETEFAYWQKKRCLRIDVAASHLTAQ